MCDTAEIQSIGRRAYDNGYRCGYEHGLTDGIRNIHEIADRELKSIDEIMAEVFAEEDDDD